MIVIYTHRQTTQQDGVNEMELLENQRIWIITSNQTKRMTASLVTEVKGKFYKKQIKISEALEIIKTKVLESDGSAVKRIQVYK